MKTITVLQNYLLQRLIKGCPASTLSGDVLPMEELIIMGLVHNTPEGPCPVKGESYNYSGNTYTI